MRVPNGGGLAVTRRGGRRDVLADRRPTTFVERRRDPCSLRTRAGQRFVDRPRGRPRERRWSQRGHQRQPGSHERADGDRPARPVPRFRPGLGRSPRRPLDRRRQHSFAGGADPRTWSFNSLLLVDLQPRPREAPAIPGAQFGTEFLQFNGQHTNGQAGVVAGYNSLPGPPPLDRSELYELWWRQRLFDDKLIVRIGKIGPDVRLQQRRAAAGPAATTPSPSPPSRR